MKRWLGTLLLAVVAACGGSDDGPLWGDAPVSPLDLRAELGASEVELLGEVEVLVDLFVGDELRSGDEPVEFAPPIPPGFEGSVAEREPRPVEGGEWRRFVLRLRPTKLGEVSVPPFEIRVGEDGPVATTPELALVVSTLLSDSGPEVEAPAPPFPPRFDPWPWIAGGLALLALVAVLWWWRRRRPEVDQAAGTPVPAHVKAQRALGKLRQEPRSTPAQVERFYVEVSHILRVYLEERFGLHAPERTTEEFLAEVEAGSALSAEHRVGLRPFLQQCDLVKFARALPDERVHLQTFEVAEQFVEATREDRIREGAA